MKATIYATIFATFASFTAAQGSFDISSVPSCALPCAMSSSPAGCNTGDFECYCTSQSWLQTLAACVAPACPSETDRNNLITMAQSLCGTYSVTISSGIFESATATASPSASGSGTNGTVAATITPTSTGSAASQTSPNAAGQVMVGSGLMAAAAAGVAMFVL